MMCLNCSPETDRVMCEMCDGSFSEEHVRTVRYDVYKNKKTYPHLICHACLDSELSSGVCGEVTCDGCDEELELGKKCGC